MDYNLISTFSCKCLKRELSHIFILGIDMREFASFVFYGFVFISVIQLIGHFNYDEAPTSVSCVKT